MISQTAEYALRAIVRLAGQGGKAMTTKEIADATALPPGYLSKVMRSLSRASVVRSRPGRQGGFTLVKKPADLMALEVVNAIDPLKRIESCPLRLNAHQQNLCVLHSRINDAIDLVEDAFRGTSIADLLEKPLTRSQRCRFPHAHSPASS